MAGRWICRKLRRQGDRVKSRGQWAKCELVEILCFAAVEDSDGMRRRDILQPRRARRFSLDFKHPRIAGSLARWFIHLRKPCFSACSGFWPGAESFVDIARGRREEARPPRKSRACRRAPFQGGPRHAIPLASPSPDLTALQRCFVARVAAPTKTPAEFVAIVLRFRSG